MVEAEDEVQEFELNQDAGVRQVLSVQVDVSEVRSLRSSTGLVLAMNSMDVGRREGARGVIDGSPLHSSPQSLGSCIPLDLSIGHAISVVPESDVYRFRNGCLLTSTERVTVPVLLADLCCRPPALRTAQFCSCSLVETLLKDFVWTSKAAARLLEYSGRSQPLEDSVAGHYCVTLSPERYVGLLKVKSSPDPPSRLRPRPTSFVPRSKKSKLASTLEVCFSVCSGKIRGQLKPERTPTDHVFGSDQRVVLQAARD